MASHRVDDLVVQILWRNTSQYEKETKLWVDVGGDDLGSFDDYAILEVANLS